MTKQRSQLQNNHAMETWREELSREKKYKEATLKRSEEKRLQLEREKKDELNKRGR
jgi:hypothetical protein